ncbi:MAG: endolytic transglycosylase MltG [Gammaproteobacteria bacterium]|nr:endolytic transglycosylase MltG [Gammaproteobacteria bacterium]
MLKRIGIYGILVGLVIIASASAYVWHFWQEQPLAFDEPVTITVEPGASLGRVAARLEGEGIVASALELRLLARIENKAHAIKAGEYRVEPGITLAGLLDKLVAGDVVQYEFTIVEGMNWRELRAKLLAEPALVDTISGMSDAEVMAALGESELHPEGQFLPETYRFTRGTTDLEFLARAHEDLQTALATAWDERVDGIPLDSPYEALILASIIEKETGIPSERREIAGVFTRRLIKGMRLQTDPTVIYGLGEDYTGDIRYRDLRTDTPYNTYTRGGLPPTPIAMAGVAAIEAAVDPAEGKTLYFVATGDGGHVFSETLDEHNRHVRRYQMTRRPLDEDRGDGE